MSSEFKQLPVDYATKDFDGFMEMFKENIPVLTPEWTDTRDTDAGMVILQLLAYGLHVLSFGIDKGVQENILQLAKTRRAVYLLTKFLGYDIKKQTASKTTVEFTKRAGELNKEVIIPQGYKVSTDPELGEQIIFETDEPLTIPAGQSTGQVTVTQGQSVIKEEIGIGNGEADQKFALSQLDVLEDTIYVQTEENGSIFSWTLVENFIDSLPQDRHFMTELTEEGQTLIVFGNGVSGMRPPLNAVIESSYRHGGGSKGNVATGKINTFVDSYVSELESVTNTEDATGGTDYEDLERAKIKAPQSYRTGGSAVTPEDFEDLAETFAGISRAVCVETFNANSDVHLYLATEDGVPLTQELMDEVKEAIEEVMVMNQNLSVFPVAYHDYTITMDVYLHDNFAQSNVEMEVRGLVEDYLNPNNFDFGETIYLSKIIHTAFGARGVKNVVITDPTGDITPSSTELPRLTTLNLNLIGGVANG